MLTPSHTFKSDPAAPGPLVTSRNKCDAGPFRWPRPYVQRCGQGSLALFQTGGRVRFTALACGSWSCPTCRKRLAARLLDRARRGMESRPDVRRWLVTLTCDPLARGAVPLGSRVQADGRVTNIVSEPSPEQFRGTAEEFQRSWERLRQAWGAFCRRRGWERPGYLRVIELHRNGWPHWHVVLEHSELTTGDVEGFLERQWTLGRWDVRLTDVDGAVGEIVPYLVAAERKSGGDKAYQFAALALPKHFRLWSSSQGFLADDETEELADVEHGVAVAGDVSSWYAALDEVAEQRVWLMHPPQADGSFRPPDAFVASGGNMVAFYAELVRATALHQRLHVHGFLAEFGVQCGSDLDRVEISPGSHVGRGRSWTLVSRSECELVRRTAADQLRVSTSRARGQSACGVAGQ